MISTTTQPPPNTPNALIGEKRQLKEKDHEAPPKKRARFDPNSRSSDEMKELSTMSVREIAERIRLDPDVLYSLPIRQAVLINDFLKKQPHGIERSPSSLSISSNGSDCDDKKASEICDVNGALSFENVNTPIGIGSDKKHTQRRFRQMKIIGGTANPQLAREVAEALNTSLCDITISPFADGEIGIQVLENVRGKDVYLIQPTCPPGVNDNLVELILMISTMRRASAQSITAILPYYGYARQDRKMASRVPISAADVARLLEAVGVDRVVAVDLHCGQIQGFFGPKTPCDNLDGSMVAVPYFLELGLESHKTVVVSPDAGGVYRAKSFRDGLSACGLEAGFAMIIKQRSVANRVDKMDLVGDVSGCDVIIIDDMIDTAGTLCAAGKELNERGARRIFAFATHGLFSGPAIQRIEESSFEKVIVCNTIPVPENMKCDKITHLSIAQLIAKAIYSIQFKKSMSELFKMTDKCVSPHPIS